MSKLFAILGDIHANLEALNVVLDDCRAQGVTDYLCTGDVVGYNACPHECIAPEPRRLQPGGRGRRGVDAPPVVGR